MNTLETDPLFCLLNSSQSQPTGKARGYFIREEGRRLTGLSAD
ncbi:MAG: hypothetical protein ACXAEI_01490 [Candidatus Hodarchaeales archaeon]|jgi:hypothetical protein